MTRVRQVVEVTTIRSRPTGVKSPGSVVVEDLDAGVPRNVVQVPECFVPDEAHILALDDPRPVRVAQPDQFGDLQFAVFAKVEVVPVEDFLGG